MTVKKEEESVDEEVEEVKEEPKPKKDSGDVSSKLDKLIDMLTPKAPAKGTTEVPVPKKPTTNKSLEEPEEEEATKTWSLKDALKSLW